MRLGLSTRGDAGALEEQVPVEGPDYGNRDFKDS